MTTAAVAVDGHDRILLSTGAADIAPQALVRVTAAVPVGRVVAYDNVEGLDDLSAIRIPSPGITLEKAGESVKPAAFILAIDTSVDDSTTDALFARQLAVVAGALVLLLALAVLNCTSIAASTAQPLPAALPKAPHLEITNSIQKMSQSRWT
ncbi:hypothetical protein [Streptomyces sp. NPDC001348]